MKKLLLLIVIFFILPSISHASERFNFGGGTSYIALATSTGMWGQYGKYSTTTSTTSLWYLTNEIIAGGGINLYSEGSSSNGSGTPFFRIVTSRTTLGDVGFEFRGDTGSLASKLVSFGTNDGRWHNVVVVRTSPISITLYVDGKSQGATAITGNVLSADRACIGALCRNTTSATFSGVIGDVRIYNYAMTANEVRMLNQGGNLQTGLLYWYPLNSFNYYEQNYGRETQVYGIRTQITVSKPVHYFTFHPPQAVIY